METICNISSPDKRWYAEVSAHRGANVITLQFENEDVLVPLRSQQQYEENPFLIGSPLLFPANRTYKGTFVFEGKRYTLPINDAFGVANLHGTLHTKPFTVITDTPRTVVLRHENAGEVYPFPFRITVTYTADDNGFDQQYDIENVGDGPMPFTFALHTAFAEPAWFRVPIGACQEKDDHHIPTGRYVALDPQESRYGEASPSRGLVISGYYSACGHAAQVGEYTYTVSENFDHWILYNGEGKSGLLCVEPQAGAVDGLNSVDRLRILRAGERETFRTRIARAK